MLAPRFTLVLATTALANALLAAWLVERGRPVTALPIAWSALSVTAVAVLYGFARIDLNPGGILRGERHAWLQPVFFPYRAVAWCTTLWSRIRRGRSAHETCVAPGLYLGARPFAFDTERLSAAAIDAVVDLCAELPVSRWSRRHARDALVVPTLDRVAPTPAEIEQAVGWIVARLGDGRRVLVHCAFGRGRSATLVAATLVATGTCPDPETAVAHLSALRPSSSIRDARRAALERWFQQRRAGR